MNIMEIVLLIIGALVFVASFLIPLGKGDSLAHDRDHGGERILGDCIAADQ